MRRVVSFYSLTKYVFPTPLKPSAEESQGILLHLIYVMGIPNKNTKMLVKTTFFITFIFPQTPMFP